MPANAGNVQYFLSDEFDMAGGGTVVIGNTGPDVKLLGPTSVRTFIISQSGVLLSGKVSVGTNSPDYDNIAPLQGVGGLGNLIRTLSLEASIVEIPADTNLVAKYTSPTPGSAHQNIRVVVDGVRIPQ